MGLKVAKLVGAIVTGAMILLSIGARAAERVIFVNLKGEQITNKQALMSDEESYKCTLGSSGVSKSGTSLSFKNKKKAITQEELERQIEELKKRVETK